MNYLSFFGEGHDSLIELVRSADIITLDDHIWLIDLYYNRHLSFPFERILLTENQTFIMINTFCLEWIKHVNIHVLHHCKMLFSDNMLAESISTVTKHVYLFTQIENFVWNVRFKRYFILLVFIKENASIFVFFTFDMFSFWCHIFHHKKIQG